MKYTKTTTTTTVYEIKKCAGRFLIPLDSAAKMGFNTYQDHYFNPEGSVCILVDSFFEIYCDDKLINQTNDELKAKLLIEQYLT